MNFEIGQEVKLNGKTYKITGTHKRSWLLTMNGKTFKATSALMKKIYFYNAMISHKNVRDLGKNERGLGVGKRNKREKRSATFHMEKRLAYNKIFNPDAKMPETDEELMKALDVLCGELSPENLSCDGEISRSAMMKKASALRAEWNEVEKKLGRKVSEEEAENHWLRSFNN